MALLPEARLDLFHLERQGGHLGLEGWMRELLLPFQRRLETWEPRPLEAPPSEVWSVAEGIVESLPLFRSALRELAFGRSREELARKGLKKAELARLRSASGLPPFGRAAGFGLDFAELLARFLLLFDLADLAEEVEPCDAAKALARDFFEGKRRKLPTLPRSSAHEYEFLADCADYAFDQYALLDHLIRRPGGVLAVIEGRSPARRDFRAASPGDERLALCLRADSVRLDGRLLDRKPYSVDFPVDGALRTRTLAKPAFESYVYLFATLGLLEIAEAAPPEPLVRKGKTAPFSPADCLAALRLTEFGRWCLGWAKERPAHAAGGFEAIADSELLVVTFRGRSLERKLYLDRVASTLGEERWRFTEARFIEGCARPAEIESRVEDFRRLIDPEPSPRWTAFFEGLRARAAVLQAIQPAALIPLPADPAIRRAFLEHPKIRALAKRVEDGSVVVAADKLPLLAKLLAAEGFWTPEFRKPAKRGPGSDWG